MAGTGKGGQGGPRKGPAGGGSGSGGGGADAAPPVDLDAFLSEMKVQVAALGKQFREVADKVGEEAQYHLDKELARALAKHPELYAEVRKTLRQIKRTADKAAETLGLKP